MRRVAAMAATDWAICTRGPSGLARHCESPAHRAKVLASSRPCRSKPQRHEPNFAPKGIKPARMSIPETRRIRVLMVDDSEMVRTGLRALLATEAALEVVGEAANLASGVEASVRLKPDVVLMDIRLPDGTGIDACRQIRKRSPDSRVLMVTSVIDDSMVDDAIRAGAH